MKLLPRDSHWHYIAQLPVGETIRYQLYADAALSQPLLPAAVAAALREVLSQVVDAGVITSYSIHYTKLYDPGQEVQRPQYVIAFSQFLQSELV